MTDEQEHPKPGFIPATDPARSDPDPKPVPEDKAGAIADKPDAPHDDEPEPAAA